MSDAYYANGGGNSMPSYAGDRANAIREIRKLWKRLGEPTLSNAPPLEKAWSYSGTVNPVVSITGQPWVAPGHIALVNLQLTLAVASTTDYTVTTIYEGIGVMSIATIPAGFTEWLAPLGFEVTKGHRIKPVLSESASGNGEQLGMVYRYQGVTK